ncbi:MAG: protein translocase subunit SecF [Dehalococcoidia bacterium]|nr:MAG: protein translocase subunit SecF [Dehalococcoidia bacterium]
MFDFVTRRKWFFLASGLVILIGIISLIASGLNLGIEFSSGTTMTLVFEDEVGEAALRDQFTSLDHSNASIQHSAKDAFLLGMELPLDPKERGKEKDQLAEALQARFDTTIRIADFSAVGNTTSPVGNATLALIFGKTVGQGDLSDKLADLGYSGFSIESTTLDSYLIRTETIDTQEEDEIKQALEEEFGLLDSLDVYSISPEVAAERVQYTTYAVIAAAAGILLYITWAFRKLVRPISYGVCAIVALVHDALIVLGVFSLFSLEVNSMFIIALLTVIGYSVNNTIVVFDRIRENRRRDINVDFASVVNASLTETLGRSLSTSLTTLFVLLALLLFGGATISNFVLALTIGVIVGTYSSLFIAGPLVVSWERGELRRLFNWIPLRREQG